MKKLKLPQKHNGIPPQKKTQLLQNATDFLKTTKNKSNKAPIKKLVEKIIVSSPNVLAANSAIRSNGGRGATVLLIKS